ncbi:MAG: cation:proton antiporter [Actinomycetota bacterium]|nr:cation:proton antiporter [Actinomycetota bacterium]
MALVLVFAGTLLAAVLLSGLAERTVLSTAVLFLVVGFLAGGVTNFLTIRPEDPLTTHLAELALFAVLFTDGMRVGVQDLTYAWRLPGRALLLGLPLTLLFTAALAHFVVGLPWLASFLVGAVLSPTDPVFASALVGREEVPLRLRRLLNVESGVNDGLALPIVVVLLAVASQQEVGAVTIAEELALGVVIGVAVPWIALRLERTRLFDLAESYEPLYAFSVGLLVLALGYVTHANLFLAAFSAGITVVSVSPQFRDAFHQFGELLAELLKLAAILVFGALISPVLLMEIGLGGYVFALLALVVVRPVALAMSFLGARINLPEFVAAAWFGPKGFASVVYGLLVLESGVALSEEMFHLIALVVAASIVLHSSTDVIVARRFREADLEVPN